MAETIFKDGLFQNCCPGGFQKRCHQRRLGIGGEGRIGPRHNGRNGPQGTCRDGQSICFLCDLAACQTQGIGDRPQMGGNKSGQCQRAAGAGCRAEPGGGFHPVRQDPVFSPVERTWPHREAGASGPGDLSPTGSEEGDQVVHLRFRGSAQDPDGSFRAQSGQQQIFRGADAGIA